MAITRDFTGELRMLKDIESPHVALLHQKVRDSHNAGNRHIAINDLRIQFWEVFPDVSGEEVDRALLNLVQEEILQNDQESPNFFLHTSDRHFRLQRASGAYREATGDILEQVEGDEHALLVHANNTMVEVKAVGKDTERARPGLRRLKS